MKKEIRVSILIILFICFWVIGGIKPIIAGMCGTGISEGANCCPQAQCQGKNYGQQDCITGELCCEVCTGKGITNPAISTRLGTGEGADILARLIANFLKITFSIAGLVLLAMLLLGGIQWMTAGGDKEKITKAQGRITSALIGFVIYMSVFAIINFIAPALGLQFLQILKIEWPTP